MEQLGGPANKDRFLVEALRALAKERAIEFEAFSYDWIVRLTRGRTSRFIYGYNFDLNPSAASWIATDKCALSDVLERSGIPHVEHEFFLTPRLSAYLGSRGNWRRAMRCAGRFGYPVVCKGNQGTGGNSVYLVKDQKHLEEAFQRIHGTERGLAISPFYQIEHECRLIVLDGVELLCYRKQQPHVVADGRRTFKELLMDHCAGTPDVLARALLEPSFPLKGVPVAGSRIPAIWKHNLGQGATPVFGAPDQLGAEMRKLAIEACVSAGLRFASVDLVVTNSGLRVLEVNSGIMMENLSRASKEGREKALAVYAKALDAMFP